MPQRIDDVEVCRRDAEFLNELTGELIRRDRPDVAFGVRGGSVVCRPEEREYVAAAARRAGEMVAALARTLGSLGVTVDIYAADYDPRAVFRAALCLARRHEAQPRLSAP